MIGLTSIAATVNTSTFVVKPPAAIVEAPVQYRESNSVRHITSAKEVEEGAARTDEVHPRVDVDVGVVGDLVEHLLGGLARLLEVLKALQWWRFLGFFLHLFQRELRLDQRRGQVRLQIVDRRQHDAADAGSDAVFPAQKRKHWILSQPVTVRKAALRTYRSASRMPLTAGPAMTIMKIVFSFPDTSVIM
jgi:hypothetical protein